MRNVRSTAGVLPGPLRLALFAVCMALSTPFATAATSAETDASMVTAASKPPPLSLSPLNVADCNAMRAAHVIDDHNPLPCARLVRVTFSYIDFEGREKTDGEMIVMDALAPHVQRLMAQLHTARFPLHSAHPLTDYAGDDSASMTDNNSSAFNGRPITGGGDWSKHAYGVAIDINPLQNPYISREDNGHVTVMPAASTAQFTDRKHLRPGMTETVLGLFADNGFMIWGGNWHQPIDYQHFEIGERSFVEKLARSTPAKAAKMMDRYVRTYQDCVALRASNAAYQAQCADKTKHSVD